MTAKTKACVDTTAPVLPHLTSGKNCVDLSGIELITPQGIRTKDGKEIDLDIIVYATGYFA